MTHVLKNVVHGWFCERSRCKWSGCTAVQEALLKMEHHVSRKSCQNCKTRQLWCRLDGLDLSLGWTNDNTPRYDRSKPFWRASLLAEREAVRLRHLQLMRRWRAVVRCITPLVQAKARAAQKAYAPGEGRGYRRAREEFESLRATLEPGSKKICGAERDVTERHSDVKSHDGDQARKRACGQEVLKALKLDNSKKCNAGVDCAALLVRCL